MNADFQSTVVTLGFTASYRNILLLYVTLSGFYSYPMPVYKHTNIYILSVFKAISGFLSIIYIIWLWFFFFLFPMKKTLWICLNFILSYCKKSTH